MQARVTAAASQCLALLADFVRRGKCGELWEALLGEVGSRLATLQQATVAAAAAAAAAPATGGGKAKKRSKAAAATAAAGGVSASAAAAEARRSAARGLSLLCQFLEYYRGSRVEDYRPMFALAARLVGLDIWSPSAASSLEEQEQGAEREAGGGDDAAADEDEQAGEVPDEYDYRAHLDPSLTGQALRLLCALAYSHTKAAGASEGPAAIARAAPVWSGVFSKASRREALPFVRALISPPSGAELARLFGPQMLGAVGRCLLAGTPRGIAWRGFMQDSCIS